MSSSADVLTVVPGVFVSADIRQSVADKTNQREGAEMSVDIFPPKKQTESQMKAFGRVSCRHTAL